MLDGLCQVARGLHCRHKALLQGFSCLLHQAARLLPFLLYCITCLMGYAASTCKQHPPGEFQDQQAQQERSCNPTS